ncbi:hypothetical protein EDB36_10586 [Vibrio crassostreae]|nr:hypothetical protein EDB36_10586 [Vibrio crassostreae]
MKIKNLESKFKSGRATKLEKPEQFMLLWLFAFLNLYNLRPALPNQ